MAARSTPDNPLRRITSLLRTGPRGIALRFYDQLTRKWTGYPVWNLSRITPNLYIGGQHSVHGWQKMQQEGIEAIVNMREPHLDDARHDIAGAYHLHLPTTDNTPPSLDDLQRAADFIRQHIEAGRKVYVHCGVGVGRAPSAAAAYLIQSGMSAMDALNTIHQVRPFVHLTPRQMRQLEQFEQMQREKTN